MVARSIAAGLGRIEVTSFVSPRRVPALADADALMAALPRSPGVRYAALVANLRGCERAVAAQLDELDYVLLATDVFSQRNQGVPTAAALESLDAIAEYTHAAGLRLTVTIGAAFGCPFTGEVSREHVVRLAQAVVEAGADELALADTIGVATPDQVAHFAQALRDDARVPLRFHFHNTRNTGYANAVAALANGVSTLDASMGGIGGCPFAPGATGNIASEDLCYLANRMGYVTGLDVSHHD